MRPQRAAWLACALVILGACGHKGPATVDELVAALVRQGLAYDVSETAALESVAAEGLRLRGPGLEVEVYRIEGRKDMDRAAAAAALLAGARSRDFPGARPAIHLRRPFLIVVLREPQDGFVASALAAAFAP